MRKVKKCKKSNYSVIVMRDDCSVRTWQIKRGMLRFLLFSLVLLLSLTVLGIFATYRYTNRYYDLQTEFRVLKADYVKSRLELERLTNVKTLVEQTSELDLTPAKNEELAATSQALQSLNGSMRGLGVAQENTSLADGSTVAEAISVVVNGNTTSAKTNASSVKVEDASAASIDTAASIDATAGIDPELNAVKETINNINASISPAEVKRLVETSPLMTRKTLINVSNFLWRGAGESKITLRFDLNVQNGLLYSGRILYIGETDTGEYLLLPTLETSSSSNFATSRLKKIESLVSIKDVALAKLKRLIIVVELDDGKTLQWSFVFNR